MNKRQIIISTVSGIIILVIAVIINKQMANSAKLPERKMERTYKTVSTTAVRNGQVQFKLPVYGKLSAYNRIQIYAEVNGILQPTSQNFLEGVSFSKGERLLQIDNTEAMANLMGQRSNYLNAISAVLPDLKLDYPADFNSWLAYLENIDINSNAPTPPKATSKKAELYLTSRGVYSSYYNLKSAEARLEKYDIHAPFAGVVTLSNIRPGTLVRPGQLLGEFISAGMYELETSISIRFLPFIKEGNVVQLHSNDVPGNWKGTIKRINKKIDESTQTINLYITVNANDLREGMYMEGTLEGITVEDALAVPRRLLIDNNHLFIVQHDSVLEKKAVSILEYTEEEAIIRGLDDGLRLVKDIIPGAFSGMIVRENKQEKTN